MKKLAKMLVAAFLLAGLSASVAMASYNKGFAYYKRYVLKQSHIKGTQFLKVIKAQTPADLKPLMKDNAKGLIALLNKEGHKKAAKAIETLAKKHKLKDLQDFLVGMLNGKIPAG